MELHVPDYVIVEINGTDRTEYVISYERNDSLCELGSSFTIHFAPTYPVAILPYQTVYIEEFYNGVQANVLDGYIVSIERDSKDSDIVISGQDKTLLLTDYFIPNQILANNENIDYWIEYYCNLVGLDVEFEASAPYVTIEEGTPMGLQNVSDALMTLERKAAYYIKYDSSINKIRVFRLGSSDPVISLTTENSLEATRETGTEDTRNVVKVYGGYRFNPVDGSTTQIFAKAKTTMPELLVDKTVVVASPVLRSFSSAYMVANRILSVVDSIDDEQRITVDGFYPSIQVGDGAYINIVHANYDFRGNRQITSIVASVGPDGARTMIGVGAKCPRVSIQLPVPPIFATTTTDGVAVSWDAAENFRPSNIGLNGSDALNAWSIAVNQWGQSMVLTVAGLYKRYGTAGTWTAVSQLPDPANDEGKNPAPTLSGLVFTKVVDEPTRYGHFHLLANASGVFTPGRAWIYNTHDFGNTWDSTQLYINKVPSGYSWRVYGIDIETSPNNNLYTIVNGSPEISNAYVAAKTFLHTYKVYGWNKNTPTIFTDAVYHALTSTGSDNISMFAPANHKEICFVISYQYAVAGYTEPFIIISRTTDGGATWEELWNGVTGYTPTKPAIASLLYYPSFMMFDYANSAGDGSARFGYYCGASSLVRSTYDGTCYLWTYKAYRAGLYIDIGINGSVTFSSMSNVELSTKTWWEQEKGGGTSWNTYYRQPVQTVHGKYCGDIFGINLTSIPHPEYLCNGTTLTTYTDYDYGIFTDGAAIQPVGTTVTFPEGFVSAGNRYGFDDSLTYYYFTLSGGSTFWMCGGPLSYGNVQADAMWGGVPKSSYNYTYWDVEVREE
jgi:hypothetical protein